MNNRNQTDCKLQKEKKNDGIYFDGTAKLQVVIKRFVRIKFMQVFFPITFFMLKQFRILKIRKKKNVDKQKWKLTKGSSYFLKNPIIFRCKELHRRSEHSLSP